MGSGYINTLWGIVFFMAHEHGKAVQEPLAPLARNLRQAIPDVYAGFKELHAGAMAEGAAPNATAVSPATPGERLGLAPPRRRRPRPSA
jgi:hypothetical protein